MTPLEWALIVSNAAWVLLALLAYAEKRKAEREIDELRDQLRRWQQWRESTRSG